MNRQFLGRVLAFLAVAAGLTVVMQFELRAQPIPQTRLVQGKALTSIGQPLSGRLLLFVAPQTNFCNSPCGCDDAGKCVGGSASDRCPEKFCYQGVISRTNKGGEFSVALADAQYSVYVDSEAPQNLMGPPLVVKEGAQLKALVLTLAPPKAAGGAR